MSSGGGRRVAITGVSGHWGSQLARHLSRDSRVSSVVGIDTHPPKEDLGGIDFIEADVRSAVISRVLPSTEVDTVVHCGILWFPEPGKPARSLHDFNVIGTLQLLAACERTPTLERVVMRGSAAIYGSEGAAPLFFTEELAGEMPLRTRFQRDVSELEGYFANFARRRPEIACCMLRYQPEIGADLDTPLVRYLSLPIVPTQLGYDPRLQLLDADDAAGALLAAVWADVRGPVNIAPSGAISLSRILRLGARPSVPVPHPLFGPAVERLGTRLGAGPLLADAVRMLRFGRGVDNRKMLNELGFTPRHDAVSAVRELVSKLDSRRVGPPLHAGALLGRLAGSGR
ncbi:MAG TPA: NAD-dependent epimerase/dehydratase family protein [Solirubrobacterales bacterium]|nr:NAD-dependent epimerase/dehydratase family protein [Solirubrobacterales bacterium]